MHECVTFAHICECRYMHMQSQAVSLVSLIKLFCAMCCMPHTCSACVRIHMLLIYLWYSCTYVCMYVCMYGYLGKIMLCNVLYATHVQRVTCTYPCC